MQKKFLTTTEKICWNKNPLNPRYPRAKNQIINRPKGHKNLDK